MSTIIDIYPPTPRPAWMKVGTIVQVLGDGEAVYRVVEIQNNRAAVVCHTQPDDEGGCWESFTKIYRPGKLDEDLPR